MLRLCFNLNGERQWAWCPSCCREVFPWQTSENSVGGTSLIGTQRSAGCGEDEVRLLSSDSPQLSDLVKFLIPLESQFPHLFSCYMPITILMWNLHQLKNLFHLDRQRCTHLLAILAIPIQVISPISLISCCRGLPWPSEYWPQSYLYCGTWNHFLS